MKNKFRPMVLSRHPSHNIFRRRYRNLPLLPVRSVIRFGSTTDVPDSVSNGGSRIEVNTIESIKNSSSKLKMKECFIRAGVKTANWNVIRNNTWCMYAPNYGENMFDENYRFYEYDGNLKDNIELPIVAKHIYGSRGKGNTLIKTKEEFEEWMVNKHLNSYIFEKFVNYALEYRLHVTKEGCFYTCRKALKKDCPEDQKWRRHDDVCVWFLEENPEFKKPNSWNDIVSDCIKALKEIGADILSFDVKVQSDVKKDGSPRKYQKYILIECNSASSMGTYEGTPSICAEKYLKILPKIILSKI